MARRTRRSARPLKLGRHGFTTAPFETPDIPDYVVAELRYESPVAFTRSRFAAPAAGEDHADRLNTVLAKAIPSCMIEQLARSAVSYVVVARPVSPVLCKVSLHKCTFCERNSATVVARF